MTQAAENLAQSAHVSKPPHLVKSDRTMTLGDGRELAFTDLGDPKGDPIIFGHGMPGSRLEGWFWHQQAREHGFRLVTMDRPGIGRSTMKPWRTLLDYPKDVTELADSLGFDRFIHAGWSSGGSRTLACAYALPERVSLAIVMSSYTHFAEYPGSKRFFQATRWPGPRLAQMSYALLRAAVEVVAWISRRHPGLYFHETRQLISEQDKQLLHDVIRSKLFQQDQMACLNSGGRAMAHDLQTELLYWGFHLREVTVPVWLFQGDDDPFVPVSYAEHLADNLQQVELNRLRGSGHLYPLSTDFQKTFFGELRQRVDEGRTVTPRCDEFVINS